MRKRLRITPTLTTIIAISAILFVYLIIRAINLSITYDEAYTYLHQIDRSVLDIITYNSDQPANIHLFMTLFVKLLATLGISSELGLRSLSLVSFLGYALGSYLLVRRLQKPKFVICGFLLLVTNPFVLEFFVLARGYSISLAFMMLGLTFLADGLAKARPSHRLLLIGLTFSALAVISNLNWLFFYAGSVIAIVTLALPLHVYRKPKYLLSKLCTIAHAHKTLVLVNFVMGLFMLYTVWKLKSAGALYFGGDTGFWADTVNSLILATGYGINNSFMTPILTTIVIAGLIYMTALAVYLVVKRKVSFHRFYFGLVFTLIFMVAAEIVGHITLAIPYQTDRTALAFIPISLVCFGASLYIGWLEIPRSNQAINLLIITLAALSVLQFLATANLSYTYSFKADSQTKAMLQVLSTKAVAGRQITLGMDWEYESVVNFYRITGNYSWLAEVSLQLELKPNQDYYYIGQYTWTHDHNPNWQVVETYPVTNTLLIKAK